MISAIRHISHTLLFDITTPLMIAMPAAELIRDDIAEYWGFQRLAYIAPALRLIAATALA